MVLMAFGLAGASARKRFAIAAAGATIFGIFLVTAPGIKEVLRLAGTGGDLRGYEGQNLSDYAWVFTLFIALYALAIGAIVVICKRKKTLYEEFFWSVAGFLSLGPLILAAAVTVFVKGGNWYPVMKWIYVYFPELFIVLVFIASRGSATSVPSTAARPHPFFVVSLFIIAFLVQEPYLAPQIDLKPAILAEQGPRFPAILGKRRYPGLHVDHPALNYFIARSVLKIPTDGETFAWMGSGTMSDAYLGPADFMSVAPNINPAKSIQYKTGNSLAQRTLTNYWWPLESDHVWAAKTPARIFFIAAKPPATIRIDFVPFMPNGPQLRKFGLAINGIRMPEMTASAMDWSRPASYSAQIPPGVLKQDGRVAIAFTWDQVVKDDLGLALVAVEYK